MNNKALLRKNLTLPIEKRISHAAIASRTAHSKLMGLYHAIKAEVQPALEELQKQERIFNKIGSMSAVLVNSETGKSLSVDGDSKKKNYKKLPNYNPDEFVIGGQDNENLAHSNSPEFAAIEKMGEIRENYSNQTGLILNSAAIA